MCEDNHDQEPESSLARRLQAGDSEAFNALFERHRKGLLAYVAGLVRNVPLAEDVVQDAFLQLARKASGIDPRKGARAWLYRVARNRAFDRLRHARFEILPGDDYFQKRDQDADAPSSASPADNLVRRERADLVRSALDALPARERELLLLRFHGGLSFKEIAATVRRPISTVLWQVRRTLKKMRKTLPKDV